jgi:hypothetical protein
MEFVENRALVQIVAHIGRTIKMPGEQSRPGGLMHGQAVVANGMAAG